MRRLSYFATILSITVLGVINCRNNSGSSNIPEYTRHVDTLPNLIKEIPGVYVVILDTVKGKSLFDAMENVEMIESFDKRKNYSKQINKNFKRLFIKEEDLISVNDNRIVVKLNEPQLKLLNSDLRVKRVEKNYLITLHRISSEPVPVNEEVVPWGIKRVSPSIKQNGVYKNKAWIIDTGVDKDDSDLNVDVTLSRSFFPGTEFYDVSGQGNDHGTHIAGIIAAKANNIGVVGIAPNARIVAVKIINDNVFQNDYYLNALTYVRDNANQGDVLNLSLQNTPGTDSEIELISQIANKGIKIVIAAGNYSLDVDTFDDNKGIYPARINLDNIFTVSSFDDKDNYSTFSNFGNSVDFSSPGERIFSTLPGNHYGYMDGTSMAAPHLTGLLLLKNTFQSKESVKKDPDGKTDRIIHE